MTFRRESSDQKYEVRVLRPIPRQHNLLQHVQVDRTGGPVEFEALGEAFNIAGNEAGFECFLAALRTRRFGPYASLPRDEELLQGLGQHRNCRPTNQLMLDVRLQPFA